MYSFKLVMIFNPKWGWLFVTYIIMIRGWGRSLSKQLACLTAYYIIIYVLLFYLPNLMIEYAAVVYCFSRLYIKCRILVNNLFILFNSCLNVDNVICQRDRVWERKRGQLLHYLYLARYTSSHNTSPCQFKLHNP